LPRQATDGGHAAIGAHDGDEEVRRAGAQHAAAHAPGCNRLRHGAT
jgi:hypothetical protein